MLIPLRFVLPLLPGVVQNAYSEFHNTLVPRGRDPSSVSTTTEIPSLCVNMVSRYHQVGKEWALYLDEVDDERRVMGSASQRIVYLQIGAFSWFVGRLFAMRGDFVKFYRGLNLIDTKEYSV